MYTFIHKKKIPSKRLEPQVLFFKDYEKNIVFMDCQKQIFFLHFVELPGKNQLILDYFYDISRDRVRLQRKTTLHGRMIRHLALTVKRKWRQVWQIVYLNRRFY